MAPPFLLKQSDVFMKPFLSVNALALGISDRSPSLVVSSQGFLSSSSSFSSSSKVCCNRRREAVSSRVWCGGLRGWDLGNAEDRSTSGEQRSSVRCEAHCGGRRVEAAEYGYDLYELLGVEKDAEAEDIKRAYRWLQKRCHPDVAGVKGHDMAILLNEAYAVLSDPHRRASYDATTTEKDLFEGYTGNPLYSKWYGKPEEERAVFVEETRCIGCLKCALIAPNTFGIEAKFGRARAVTQWLDEEGTIKDAIRACPVDCISWVKKDMLPALEFIMSKQPRLHMGVNNYSYVGVRRENVFHGAARFLKKYNQRDEVQTSGFQETPAQREARLAAVQEINIKAGRWWWHDLMGMSNLTFANRWDTETSRALQGAIVPVSSSGARRESQFVANVGPKKIPVDEDADLGPLYEAARHRRRRGTTGSSRAADAAEEEEEYWTPNEPISCPLPLSSVKRSPPKSASASDVYEFVGQWSRTAYNFRGNLHESLQHVLSAVPIVISVAAAVLVGMNGGGSDLAARSETGGLISGPLPISITSGPELQLMLTAVVWYMIGSVLCEVAVFVITGFVNFRENRKSQD